MLPKMQRKGNTFVLLVGMQTGVATWENSVRFLRKLKIELPYDPLIALLLGTKMLIRRDTCIPMFIAVLSTIAKV